MRMIVKNNDATLRFEFTVASNNQIFASFADSRAALVGPQCLQITRTWLLRRLPNVGARLIYVPKAPVDFYFSHARNEALGIGELRIDNPLPAAVNISPQSSLLNRSQFLPFKFTSGVEPARNHKFSLVVDKAPQAFHLDNAVLISKAFGIFIYWLQDHSPGDIYVAPLLAGLYRRQPMLQRA